MKYENFKFKCVTIISLDRNRLCNISYYTCNDLSFCKNKTSKEKNERMGEINGRTKEEKKMKRIFTRKAGEDSVSLGFVVKNNKGSTSPALKTKLKFVVCPNCKYESLCEGCGECQDCGYVLDKDSDE